MTNVERESTVEKPLSGTAKLALAAGAGTMILLFYLFAILSIVFLLSLLAGELLIVLALARFGLAGVMADAMRRHLAPLPIFFSSFWVRKGAEFRIPLEPADAPGLFQVLKRLCDRSGVALPRVVSLEMNVNAWVRLKGYRRGAGTTILGLGFDLLAGLSQAEVEAVLAHEMMHAKLVQRGFRHWLGGGLNRASQLARGLAALAEAGRQARQSTGMTEALLRPADWLTRNCARLVAACSRQDEFAADRGAAELCGAGIVRSALVKVESISRITARLPWRERVAQLQLGEGLSQWLSKELAAGKAAHQESAEVFNPYSTHPSLRDRLAALPAGTSPVPGDSAPAIALLAEPDKTADKLIAEIHRVAAREEEKDSRRLSRWSRRLQSGSHLRPLQTLGVLMACVGGLGGLIDWLIDGPSSGLMLFMAITMVPGVLLYRFGGYREDAALPMPGFALLKAASLKKNACEEANAKAQESELRKRLAERTGKRQRVFFLAAECYAALGRADYAAAQTAARLLLETDKQSVAGALTLAVSAAGLGQGQMVTKALQFLQKHTRMAGASTAWGAGWALFLCADWVHAEAFLEQARQARGDHSTLLAMLAICQDRRGKLQSAIASARRACALAPQNKELTKLLADLLLDGGLLREAQEQLRPWGTAVGNDTELMFSMVRLNLMQRNTPGAEEWAKQLRKAAPGGHTLVRLGGIYEAARKNETAAACYIEAVATGFYPEALLGLGRYETARDNKEEARRCLLAALEVHRTPGEGSIGPLPLFQDTINHLLALEKPTLNCQAWIASLNGGTGPAALANRSLMIYASNQAQAIKCLDTLLSAMEPAAPHVNSASIGWRPAPKEQQPIGPVRPGVQGVMG